jgi:hypothetical protein
MAYGPSPIRFLTQRGGMSQTTQRPAIDQTSLYAARRFVEMRTTEEELPLSEGDREMGLAFEEEVSEARSHPAVLSTEAKQIPGQVPKRGEISRRRYGTGRPAYCRAGKGDRCSPCRREASYGDFESTGGL